MSVVIEEVVVHVQGGHRCTEILLNMDLKNHDGII